GWLHGQGPRSGGPARRAGRPGSGEGRRLRRPEDRWEVRRADRQGRRHGAAAHRRGRHPAV
ncbi:MAG: FIG00816693: hypothetical protein, partial [uncultured Corynebacteriales bacterium]